MSSFPTLVSVLGAIELSEWSLIYYYVHTVLNELDKLKKFHEGARSAIKWLEIELTKGNRFLRIQKPQETLPMPLVKIPKKLGTCFISVIQGRFTC